MPAGRPGRDDSPDNPIARALNKLLREGQPFHRLNHCYFSDGTDDLRWLGVLVHSAGDRVLFFPGFAETQTRIQGYQNDREVWNQPFVFDHASLERDRRSWHATSPRSTEHLGSPKTLEIGQGRVFWFGLSVKSSAVLRAVLESTTATAYVPQSDSRRRADVLGAAREGAEFPIMALNTEHPTNDQEYFLHFAFVVGPAGFPEYPGPELGAPFGSPFLCSPLPNPIVNVPIRLHRVALSDTVEVQVSCVALPGALTVPATVTSPSGPLAAGSSRVAS